MFTETVSMRWVAVCLISLVISSCTKPNPKSCLDGSCGDPKFPFCDVDGSFGEDPGTCIAVTCEPAMFSMCRGDQAITCNGSGNNFDLIECPLGCAEVAGGCRECTMDSQCSSEKPIC